jgi:uncharacterized protein YndB with AHSA1/START domain
MAREPVVLTIARLLPAHASAVWQALTTPYWMRRWMLVPPHTLPEAPLSLGHVIQWHDDDGQPYMTGTVVRFERERRMTFALHDRSWVRDSTLRESHKVVWDFALTPQRDGTRLDYYLGDLAIDANAEEWRRAYDEADEPARLAALLHEMLR